MLSEHHEDMKSASIKVLNHKIGDFLIEEGLISKSQMQEAYKLQSKNTTYKPIGQILVDQKAITQKQLNLILDRYHKRPKLGEILIRSGVLSTALLEKALAQQKECGLRLGEVLVKMNYITEETMRQSLCTQLNIPFINLENFSIEKSLVTLISRNYTKKNLIVPIAKLGNTVTLAMDDPTDIELVEELQAFLGLNINIVTSTQQSILGALNNMYEGIRETAFDFHIELIEENFNSKTAYLESHQSRKADALLTEIISMALQKSTTDIHIESLDNRMLVRFRRDGILIEPKLGSIKYEINKYRKELISRIKILGNLDIAEKRRPQDGSFRTRVIKGEQVNEIDFRISVIPGYYGENAVLRILDPSNAPHSIEQLGFSKKLTDKMNQLLKRNTGILLITGPTGSGKSTTLYGSLMTLYRPGIKIITAEDPIEYIYENISQCEVNTKIGNSFASYIRSFLRQDPEVIMIGEIRDSETAEMAFRAAQTGHMVLSTMHTNDAIGAVPRLLGLNADPNLITSCLLGVLSQRLVREVCTHCKEEYTPSQNIMQEFFKDPPSDISWVRGKKCPQCNYTGYNGRIPMAELWTLNENDIIQINKSSNIEELRKSSYKSTIFMSEDAMEKLRAGRTNLEELIRTLPYSNLYQFRHHSKP